MMHHSIGKIKGNMSFPTQWGTILERVMLNKFLKGNSVKVLNSLFLCQYFSKSSKRFINQTYPIKQYYTILKSSYCGI